MRATVKIWTRRMEADMTVFEKVQGKRVDVDYESGDHYVSDYLSESELRWNALSVVGEASLQVRSTHMMRSRSARTRTWSADRKSVV